ncbi:hypothetical protein ACIOK4_43430 [Streptomyces bottropensis]|uniref:hypothetical protein n=1 Tax=Streptomyces bottropensis TaxID=42235 RepID=UPI0037F260F0
MLLTGCFRCPDCEQTWTIADGLTDAPDGAHPVAVVDPHGERLPPQVLADLQAGGSPAVGPGLGNDPVAGHRLDADLRQQSVRRHVLDQDADGEGLGRLGHDYASRILRPVVVTASILERGPCARGAILGVPSKA